MIALHHLALRTTQVDRLLAFYVEWLGLPIVRDERPRSVWLGIAPGAVLMIEHADARDPAIPRGTRELVAFAVDVSERLALRTRLVAADLLEGETAHTLYFRDPDGRRLGVSTYPLQFP